MLSFSDLQVGKDYLVSNFINNISGAIVRLVAKGYDHSFRPLLLFSADVVDLSGRLVAVTDLPITCLCNTFVNCEIIDIDFSVAINTKVFIADSTWLCRLCRR